ncbi:hypothetical protein PHMEG_00021463 [Phytophthora megakarya]|uniref:Uncharacterized protein n=1 Tax=Phytophthora megakarya TaxID=4795 RepID=A0A225VLJ7_9STRA|nr:hypothetical protein PHMEG_00021463 [Phytophthora megakarya]
MSLACEDLAKKQCSRLGDVDRTATKKLKVIMKGLVNAESQVKYDNLKVALLETLGNDKDNLLYSSFMKHWDPNIDEWVMFKRGGVSHLQYHTNNRLESKYGRVKEIVIGTFTIDDLLSMLIPLQNYAEDLVEFHRVDSRPPMAEDPELTAVAMQLSEYAFRMVKNLHSLALGVNALYEIEVDGSKTTTTNPATRGKHEIDMKTRAVKLSNMENLFGVPTSINRYLSSKAFPQTDKLVEAIQAIDAKNDKDLLARWDDYGCATYGQLKLMVAVLNARETFQHAQATVNWIDKVEYQVTSVVEPFKDSTDVTKVEFKTSVEEINLGKWRGGRHTQFDAEFWVFRENGWLNSSSIVGTLFMLKETYQDAGVVNPRYHYFDTKE